MPESIAEKQARTEMAREVDGKAASTFFNMKTKEVGNFDRAYWLETRGIMLAFSLLLLAIGTVVTVIFAYIRFDEVASGTTFTAIQWFWYIAHLTSIWLTYIGGLTLEYGIRKRQIAQKKGETLSFMVGGPSFTFGMILIVMGLMAVIGTLALSTSDSPPFNGLVDDQWTPVVIAIVTPLITLLGGVLFAKAIRGKDKLAKAYLQE